MAIAARVDHPLPIALRDDWRHWGMHFRKPIGRTVSIVDLVVLVRLRAAGKRQLPLRRFRLGCFGWLGCSWHADEAIWPGWRYRGGSTSGLLLGGNNCDRANQRNKHRQYEKSPHDSSPVSITLWFFSRVSMRFNSSGNRLKIAELLSHSLLSIAGYPETTLSASMEFGIPVCAVAMTRSPISRWPATPTWPVRMTLRPIFELPASPTWAQSSVSSPTSDEWPIWTRLSILAPRRIRVSPIVARSIVELAPTSTSSSSTTIPDWTIL